VIVVGGGIAGLAASIFLARGGRSVTLFEKKRHFGGRAITHLRQGFRFNLGPHALYRAGLGAKIYRELGIPISGKSPRSGGTALLNGSRHKLPVAPMSILTSSLLSTKARFEAIRLFLKLPATSTRQFETVTVSQWLEQNVRDEQLRELVGSLMRVATYSSDPQASAAVAIDQLKLAMRGVIYVDEGWQKIVDSLHSHAVTAGVNFVSSSRVIGVDFGDKVEGLELGGLELQRRNDTMSVALPEITPQSIAGTKIPASTVVLAVDPVTAAELVGHAAFAKPWAQLRPVTLACLDVALSRLPNPKTLFAVGIDKPYYYSVHSAYAHLSPHGGALIHVAKYRPSSAKVAFDDYDGETVRLNTESRNDEQELESVLDQMQPGWRDVVVHRRFLPAMTVAHALPRPEMPRPPITTPVGGLYLAGDWVGDKGALSDAALATAREVAQQILAT
jgi:phytoene dehydrogenase-like protein